MDSKDLFIIFIGILLFIDGIYSVPVTNEDVKQRLKRQSEDEAEDKKDSDTEEQIVISKVLYRYWPNPI